MTMSPWQAVLRILLAAVFGYFFVWDWAWKFYALDIPMTVKEHLQVLSVFYGNDPPRGLAQGLLLLSRGLFGLGLVAACLWPVVEAALPMGDRRFTRDFLLIIFGACVVSFIAAMVAYFVIDQGGWHPPNLSDF